MSKATDTPRCNAERYESGPSAANYGINDPDVVVDFTFAQILELELNAALAEKEALRASFDLLAKFVERATHWQEGRPDRHDAMQVIAAVRTNFKKDN